ncbi:RecT family recombinase [Microbulbifer pacificus]|uniref:RecT family recombinase n=1 Tax=Microbulbifer pacificus TaxID=407164 RepID=UPI000CF47373|nr:RecT family recombinase [Microbulbifer pacificus]
MTNNNLQVYQGMAFGELSTQDVNTIRETIGKGCDDSQFKLFMSIAKSSGANPVLNEIYPTVRQGQLTIQYGYDFYVRKAKEAEGYLGYDVQLVHENDEVVVSRKTDDKGRSFMIVEDHKITFPRGKVIAAYAIAYREGVIPFPVFMERDEVSHLEKSNIGMQKTMWTNYFGDMFKKHVLRRALKGQFGLEFDDQTVDQNNNVPGYQRERKDITPNEDVLEGTTEETTTEEPTEEQRIATLRSDMKKKFKKLGITTNPKINKYLQDNNISLSDPATESELIGLVEILDMHIDFEENKPTSNDDELE